MLHASFMRFFLSHSWLLRFSKQRHFRFGRELGLTADNPRSRNNPFQWYKQRFQQFLYHEMLKIDAPCKFLSLLIFAYFTAFIYGTLFGSTNYLREPLNLFLKLLSDPTQDCRHVNLTELVLRHGRAGISQQNLTRIRLCSLFCKFVL